VLFALLAVALSMPRRQPPPPSASWVAFERDEAGGFSARMPGGRIALSRSGVRVVAEPSSSYAMSWVGARAVAPTGEGLLPGVANYYLGNDPGAWRVGVPTYRSVEYRGLWPGVSLAFHGSGKSVEYDFEVDPGADASRIRLHFDGPAARDIALGFAPRAYEGEDEVPVRYLRVAESDLGFEVVRRHPGRALLIDPVLAYSTYLGGSGNTGGLSVAVDALGSAYVAGATNANPGNDGGMDAFVLKLDPTGSSLVYATYLGGSLDDYGEAVAVDSAGAAYLAGGTFSTDFPTRTSFQATFHGVEDAFAAKLGPTGALVYSTYLGGSLHDRGTGVGVDGNGSAYVVGETQSADFPVLNAYQPVKDGGSDVFVTCLDPQGTALVYSTFLGGSLDDFGYGIAVDVAGNARITGFTSGPNFPTFNAVQPNYSSGGDAFAAGFVSNGTLVFSTYLGGTGTDFGQGIAFDPGGNLYIAGYTNSTDLPTVNPFQAAYGGGAQDAFVVKLGPNGSPMVYASYLGGALDDRAFGVASDADGGMIVIGTTFSANFPVAVPLQPALDGGSDAFITVLSADGSRLAFSTYLGGGGNDTGAGIAVRGAIYAVGGTSSLNFPTANALQPAFGGGAQNGWVARIAAALPDAGPLSDAGVSTDAGAAADSGATNVDAGPLPPAALLKVGCG
jgi:hypothetical protein